jgi:hypothetical protein
VDETTHLVLGIGKRKHAALIAAIAALLWTVTRVSRSSRVSTSSRLCRVITFIERVVGRARLVVSRASMIE